MGGKGSSQGTKHVNGTIAGIIGLGPLYAVDAIILGGETVWTGPLLRSASTNPVNLSTKYGTLRLYWGTEDQPADTLLNQYEEHPPYRGLAYLVFVDFDHGQSTNAYNTEVICRGGTDQDLITGASAAESLDNAWTVNPIVAAAEILTAPAWLGLSVSAIDAASAQAVADSVQGEAPSGSLVGRSASAVSPLYATPIDLRGAMAELAGMADAWLRINTAGKIEFGRWLRGVAPAILTTLTHDDFSDTPQVDFEDQDDVANSYAVEFTDSEAVHKEAKLTVDDQAGIVDAGRLNRKTLKADWLITADQATRAGQEALRRASAGGTFSGNVRYGKAGTPAGVELQPGDYVRVPISHPQAAVLVTQIIRITKCTYPADDTGPVEISGTFDPPAIPKLGTVESIAGPAQPGLVIPPITHARVLALPPPAAGESPPVHVLAARPTGLASGVGVYYDDSLAGDFPLVGRQGSYALPVSIVASLSAVASTVRIALLSGAAGADLQRDSSYLRNWVGGATEGRNDELLLILLHKEVDGTITGTASTQQVEVLSVNGAPALVAGDTFDVPVLRGRRGTTSLAFSAGSFPDVWTEYEGWIIPRYSLEGLSHSDFASMITSGATGHFRLGGYAGGTQYAPATAYAERERRSAAALDLAEYAAQPDGTTWVPALTARIPSGLAPIDGVASAVAVTPTATLPATNVQGALEDLDERHLTDSGDGYSLIASTPFGLRKILAGAGVTLAIVGGALEISAEGGSGPEVTGTASDVFSGLALGEVSAVTTGWGWASSGASDVFQNPLAKDTFTGIPLGTITEVTTGWGWTSPGTSYIP